MAAFSVREIFFAFPFQICRIGCRPGTLRIRANRIVGGVGPAHFMIIPPIALLFHSGAENAGPATKPMDRAQRF